MQNTIFCLQQTGKLITFKIAAKAIVTTNCIVNFKDIQQSFLSVTTKYPFRKTATVFIFLITFWEREGKKNSFFEGLMINYFLRYLISIFLNFQGKIDKMKYNYYYRKKG
ncbi:MAG: hypothetical protein DI535_22470 [Citrobacter freundii]|nr:MAG: hypothetical protein DI535_22470 [Citrobacter freundii]